MVGSSHRSEVTALVYSIPADQGAPWEQYMLQALIKVTSVFCAFFSQVSDPSGFLDDLFRTFLVEVILRTISLFHILLVRDETSTLYGMFGERLRTVTIASWISWITARSPLSSW